jgi:hypothetical protein
MATGRGTRAAAGQVMYNGLHGSQPLNRQWSSTSHRLVSSRPSEVTRKKQSRSRSSSRSWTTSTTRRGRSQMLAW